MKITDESIRDALRNEYEFMCHECMEEGEMTPEEFNTYVLTLNREQLIKEACVDEHFTLEEFIDSYGN